MVREGTGETSERDGGLMRFDVSVDGETLRLDYRFGEVGWVKDDLRTRQPCGEVEGRGMWVCGIHA